MKIHLAGLIFAMVFPAAMSLVQVLWGLGEGGQDHPLARFLYVAGKGVQVVFPLVFVWLVERRRPRVAAPTTAGLGLGVLFGLLVSAGMFLLYFGLLRGTAVFGDSPEKIRDFLARYGSATTGGFLVFALFISVPHSLFEEYYWRWFVFGGLRRHVPVAAAVAISGLAFMAHHVVILGFYLPGRFWTAAVPFSLCTAAGGMVWAWLYQRTDSLYGPWVSHLLVDLAIMVVGWDLLRPYLG